MWLDGHNSYRLAEDTDCECSDDLVEFRTKSEGVWKAQPDYRPYFVKGDFRQNGQADFAVIVVKRDKNKPNDGLLLIFDGPFAVSGKPPAYVGKAAPLRGAGVGVPPGHNWPVYGRNFSEGCLYKPWKRTYREDCDQDYY